MNIHIIGAATTKFGELWATSLQRLGKEAMREAISQSRINVSQIDALFVGNMLSIVLDHQANLGAVFTDILGKHIPAFHIEGACASGGLALHMAINSILAGQYTTVLVLGVEKMTDYSQQEVISALMTAGSEEERESGVTFSGLYALMAQAYIQQYNVTQQDLAAVSVKNHYHGSKNPKAQFQSVIDVKDVMKSSMIADPLKLLDCSPLSDGAAALIITKKVPTKKSTLRPVTILASEVATDTISLYARKSFTSLSSVVSAAHKAYKRAGIKTSQIDVAEIHDCFSIAEVIATEDIGFSKRGQATKDITSKKFTLGCGKTIINPSGGLKACGHPIGATGIKQMVEITEQLRGQAGARQVHNANIGLTHNVGGTGSVAVIHILQGK